MTNDTATQTQPLRLDRAALAVRHLMHPEKTRYAMNGIQISAKGTVATDGKALAWVSARPCTECAERVLNTPTVKALHKAIKGKGYANVKDTIEAVTPALPARGRRKVAVPEQRVEIVPQLLKGHFPPWEEVIQPDDKLTYLDLDPVDVSTLETIAAVFGQFGGGTACRVGYNDTEIADVFAKVPEFGELHWNAPTRANKVHEIGLNPYYLGQIAKVVREFNKTTTHVRVKIQKPNRKGGVTGGVFFYDTRGDGRTLTAVLMPLCIN